MSSVGATTVRIPRARSRAPPEGTLPGSAPEPASRTDKPASSRAVQPRPEEDGGKWVFNHGGLERSLRLFLLAFLLPPLVLFVWFSDEVATSSYAAVRADTFYLVPVFAALFGLVALVGFSLTLWRTPRAFRASRPGRLRVRPFIGRPYSVPLSEGAFTLLLEFYDPSLICSDPVELLQVVTPPSRAHRWLVEEGMLEPFIPRRAGRSVRKSARTRRRGEMEEEPSERDEPKRSGKRGSEDLEETLREVDPHPGDPPARAPTPGEVMGDEGRTALEED